MQLAAAMRHDVPLRSAEQAAGVDVWELAADAAYEATWWPIYRAARELWGEDVAGLDKGDRVADDG